MCGLNEFVIAWFADRGTGVARFLGMSQLTFGLMSGQTKQRPVAPGDILVKANGDRYVVNGIDDNLRGLVFMCTKIRGEHAGNDCIVLESEVAYRSNTP